MAKKQGEKNYLEEHSKEKVRFYKDYLYLYLSILINVRHIKKINIYDIFCGIGIYKDDSCKGSPVVAMDNIKSIKSKSSKSIKLLINDGDKTRVNIATEYIKQNYQDICEFSSYCLDAKEIIEKVKNEIYNSNKETEKNLVFIDPHGYKEVYKKDICEMMSSGNTEIILFLPISQMYRFLKAAIEDEENNSYKPLNRFISEFFSEDHPLRELKINNQIEYINYIKDVFICKNTDYSASYYMNRAKSDYYALFFMTGHIYGLDKIVETKWKLDNNCGEGFKKDNHLFVEEFNEDKKQDCLRTFKKDLESFLRDYKTNREIYEYTLKKGFLPKHAKTVLKELKLKFDREIRRNSYYLTYENYKKPIKYKVKLNG